MPPLRILFAIETLIPPRGGAERFWLELLEALAERHEATAVFLGDRRPDARKPGGVRLIPVDPPPDAGGYWATKRARREAVAAAVRAALADEGADVVATALHAGPGAVAAAAEAGIPAVVFLHSYEALCKYAHNAGSHCVPESGCRACPSAAALPAEERAELFASRREHTHALASATTLVAPSAAVASRCEAWSGRRPVLVPDVVRDTPPARADHDGPVVLAAASWAFNKGRDLLEPFAAIFERRVLRITAAGLGPELERRLSARPGVRIVPNAPVEELLDGAAALLVPSQWPEPFGRLAFEGLAARVPTLASATGGLLEYVPPAQLVDPPDSPVRWRDALEALLEPGEWEAARQRGRSAAQAVLATDPVRRAEDVLIGAAASGGAAPRRYGAAPVETSR